MKFLKFVPAAFSFCLIVGILIGYHFDFNPNTLFIYWVLGLISITIIYYFSNKKIGNHYLFTIISYVIFILIGMTSVTIKKVNIKTKYYGKFILPNKPNSLILKIKKELKPTKHQHKYKAEIVQINKQQSIGKILLNINKDSIKQQYNIGDILYTKQYLQEINPPKNPFSFDYKTYLKTKQIHYQVYCQNNTLFYLRTNKEIQTITSNIINKINRNLQHKELKKDELAIINALVLGQRKEISKKLITDYQNAGAIHILAVSGLHIGILFGILLLALTPLKKLFYKNNSGKIIQYTLAILLLWLYAVLTGLSSSVVRSVAMFSALGIGILMHKKTATVNNLFISAFLLLLFNPFYIFDIGFQLSYLAVFSIIYWNPVFQKLWHPKLKILRVLWNVFTVSLSAQIGILPLSLYYFHQFPILFFVSGIIILPFLGILLSIGFLTVTLAYFNVVPDFLLQIINLFIRTLNRFVSFIAKQEFFLIKEIFFPAIFIIMSYLLIIFIYRLTNTFHYQKLILLLVQILLFQSVVFYYKYLRESEKEGIVFTKNNHTLIGIKQNNQLLVYHNLDSIKNNQIIKNYRIGNGITHFNTKQKIPNILFFNQHKILIIDSLGVYQIKNLNPEIVLLRNSPKINIERMIHYLKPELIIADASNFTTYTNYYQKKAKELNTPFYNTKQKGAFVLKR